jgi:glucose-1-phosphate thymidylyltransferase
MLPIANKPMLMYGFDQMRAAGIREIGVILGPLHEGIVESLGDGTKFGVRIKYIDQPDPKGIAHAVLISRKFLGDSPFIVHLGDNLLKDNIPEIARKFQESGSDASVVLSKVNDPSRFGVVEIKNGKIVKLVEKPKQHISDLALTGVYFLRASIFPVIEKLKPSWRNELEITDALQNLLNEGGRIKYHIVSGWWKDTGRPEDILEANQLVLKDLAPAMKGNIENQASLSGNVAIGEGSVVRQGAFAKGPVVIGENSEIGGGASVGPYASVGSHVKILGAEIENSIILDGALIDCKEKIVDSIIGKNSTITSDHSRIDIGRRFVVGESTFVSL